MITIKYPLVIRRRSKLSVMIIPCNPYNLFIPYTEPLYVKESGADHSDAVMH